MRRCTFIVAWLCAFLPGCRVGPIKAVPFVGYSHSTDGTGSNAVHGGFSFDMVPDPPPVREVAEPPRPFPDGEWVAPDPAPPGLCPACAAAVTGFLDATAAEPAPDDGPEAPAHQGGAEAETMTLETPWGPITTTMVTLNGLFLAILGWLGFKKVRTRKEG